MSASTDVTIWCDAEGCFEWAQGEAGWNASRVRGSLYPSGWIRVRRDGRTIDVCSECAGEG